MFRLVGYGDISADNAAYNRWRRDISCEYAARTGRAFPSIFTEIGRALRFLFVAMSDREYPPTPVEAVDEAISLRLLQG
jgi:hypothetical protein